MTNELTHLDLFSGIGGFSLAFEAEGFRTIGFAEIDPYASAVLKKHWPDVPNYGDANGIEPERISSAHGCIDVITGGVPCQPASVRGKRRGESDGRWLWPTAIGLVRKLRPAFALFENPTGILSLDGGRSFEGILCQIIEAGYDCWWQVVPASCVGTSHQRDRVWILANANSIGYPRGRTPGNKTKHSPKSLLLHDWPKGPRAQSKIPREIDGIPRKLDRVRCLGNAIVPQVAQIFARAIKQTLTPLNDA